MFGGSLTRGVLWERTQTCNRTVHKNQVHKYCQLANAGVGNVHFGEPGTLDTVIGVPVTSKFPVVDLFAGPGGLNEGFSQACGGNVFQTVISAEVERWAHETLLLRKAVREAGFPESYYQFLNGKITWEQFRADELISRHFNAVVSRSPAMELGKNNREKNDFLIQHALEEAGIQESSNRPWALIGGPPCQAYSLIGRARRRHDATFSDDHKHVLYREYLHILKKFRPSVFVMENVRGILTSKLHGNPIFDQILRDLKLEGAYRIHSLVTNRNPDELTPGDFVINAADYGVPQARQRVILLGISTSRELTVPVPTLKKRVVSPTTVREAIEGLPRVRSMISPVSKDNEQAWRAIRDAAVFIVKNHGGKVPKQSVQRPPQVGGALVHTRVSTMNDSTLDKWLVDKKLTTVTLHESRSHMPSDLKRYFFLANHALTHPAQRQPTVTEFPEELVPAHKNIKASNAPFVDRFRVQTWDGPSSTIVAHLSKDGHHFIHPDPSQMRSLTVREAARLQTFPDNYYFRGPRTAQFQQVGNAVPPFLAKQIGEIVAELLSSMESEGSSS